MSTLSSYEFDRMAQKVAALEEKVKQLQVDAGEDFTYFQARSAGYPRADYRVSAMDGVHLLMKHLGLRFNRVEQVPARTELIPLDKVKAGRK